MYSQVLRSAPYQDLDQPSLRWYEWEKLWYAARDLSTRLGLLHAAPHTERNSEEKYKWARALFEIAVNYEAWMQRLMPSGYGKHVTGTIAKTALEVLGHHLFSNSRAIEELACSPDGSGRECVFWFFRENKGSLIFMQTDPRLRKQELEFVEKFCMAMWKYGRDRVTDQLPFVVDLLNDYRMLDKLLSPEPRTEESWVQRFTKPCRDRLYELACKSDRPDPKTYKEALLRGSQSAQVLAAVRAALRS